MSDAEEAWANKIGFLPSRNPSDVGPRNDLAARYRPDASLITPHSRNYCPNLQKRQKKNRDWPQVTQWESAFDPRTQGPRAHVRELYPLMLPLGSSASSALTCVATAGRYFPLRDSGSPPPQMGE